VEQRVVPDVGVKVPFFVHEDLEVGSEKQRGVDGVETEDFEVVFNNELDDPECEKKDQDEDWVQPFDSAAVKVDERELVVADFLGDDLGDEKTGDDEEDVDSDEASWNGFGPGMVNYDRNDSNRSQPIDFRSVILVM
jgi:hypothetical protein